MFLFIAIVIIAAFAMFMMCLSYFQNSERSVLSITVVVFGVAIFFVGCCVCIVAASDLQYVEKNREQLEIESIDARIVDGLQEYIVTTADGDVYETDSAYYSDSYVSVEESETDEFALYYATYTKESDIFGFALTVGAEDSHPLLALPHEYWLRHNIKNYDDLTNIFSSGDENNSPRVY